MVDRLVKKLSLRAATRRATGSLGGAVERWRSITPLRLRRWSRDDGTRGYEYVGSTGSRAPTSTAHWWLELVGIPRREQF
jgi:hypothetical protein